MIIYITFHVFSLYFILQFFLLEWNVIKTMYFIIIFSLYIFTYNHSKQFSVDNSAMENDDKIFDF